MPIAFKAFTDVLHSARTRSTVPAFADLVDDVIAALGAFDTEMARGKFTSGEYQAKGLFFNELIASLIERRAGAGVAKRGKRPGILLANVDVDICYPSEASLRPEVI